MIQKMTIMNSTGHLRGKIRTEKTMRKRTIVFLGGSPDQSTSYLAAQAMGLYIIGFDGNPDAYAFQYADEFHAISVRDYESIFAALKDRRIDGIYSQASDAARMTEYKLAQLFKVPKHISIESVHASMDKGYFLTALKGMGLPAHNHIKQRGKDEMLQAVAGWQFPFVVKPNDSSGSKGVRVVANAKELDSALTLALEVSPTDTSICEQLVNGTHYSVDCFMRNHEIEFMAVSRKYLTDLPLFVTMQYVTPANIPATLHARMRDYVYQICIGLDIESGPITCDVVLSHDDVLHFIEIGARAGGNGLSLLLDRAFGINYVSAAVALHLGEHPRLVRKPERFVALLTLTTQQVGQLEAISGLATLLAAEVIADYKLFFKPGERVSPYTKAANALGYILLEDENIETLEIKIKTAGDQVRIKTCAQAGVFEEKLALPPAINASSISNIEGLE